MLSLLATQFELAGYLHTLTLRSSRHCKLDNRNRAAFQTSTDALNISVHHVHRQHRAQRPPRREVHGLAWRGACRVSTAICSSCMPYTQHHRHTDLAAIQT